MKATAIQLNVNTASIIFFSVYNLPRKITERKLDLLIGTGHKVILAGDFNAKHVTWRARKNNAAAKSLLNLYYKSNYVISAPSQPTPFPYTNPTGAEILDFTIISDVDKLSLQVTWPACELL